MTTPRARRTSRERGNVAGKHTRYLPGHKGLPDPLPERVENGCLLHRGYILNNGYGMAAVSYGPVVYQLVHVIAYEAANGPIPERIDGEPMLTVDHNCHNIDPGCPGGYTCLHRRCIEPTHLRLVTFGENVRAGKSPWGVASQKTHCPQGHAYDEENTFVQKKGGRICRTCARDHGKKYYKRNYQPAERQVKTHCHSGHEYTPDNTYVAPSGIRQCRECKREYDRRSARARRAQQSGS